MAVGTLNQALIDLVVKGHVKARFDIGMALKAKSWLADLEHRRLRSSLMHRVTADAAHVGLSVRGAEEVWMSACVAAQASGIHGFSVCPGKVKDLGLVASRVHMCLPWPVATLAGDTFSAMFQCQLGVRIRVELICFRCVTSRASLGTDVVSRIV